MKQDWKAQRVFQSFSNVIPNPARWITLLQIFSLADAPFTLAGVPGACETAGRWLGPAACLFTSVDKRAIDAGVQESYTERRLVIREENTMNHSRFTSLTLLCLASILLTAASPLPDVTPGNIIGQHVVARGETLYCIGRGYAILPSAIAKVNSLSGSSILSIGQVLNIPAARWANVPAGPVCTPQFQSPFTGLALLGC